MSSVSLILEPGLDRMKVEKVQNFERALDEFLAQYALQRVGSTKAGAYVSWRYISDSIDTNPGT